MKTVFLLDVDNTLLDNDRIIEELEQHLKREIGVELTRRYFAIFEQLRNELGYADYLGALQRYRVEHVHQTGLSEVSSFLINYPFAKQLFPGALDVIKHLDGFGTTVILTDGDVVFQPHKIERSGLHAAVGGRVLIYVHKEQELADVKIRFPADHYVLIDDKVRILSDIKRQWQTRVTTVFPKQGHYARDPNVASYPTPDIAVARIGDLVRYDIEALR